MLISKQDTTKASFEVMIWLGQFGASTQQIGLKEGAIGNQVVNGTTFSLFSGVNGLDQTVMTWVASTAATGVTDFYGDIGPLLQGLTGLGGPTVNGKHSKDLPQLRRKHCPPPICSAVRRTDNAF